MHSDTASREIYGVIERSSESGALVGKIIGLPVILGGFVVTQPVLDVARSGSRMDLVKALRASGLPVTHAARGAAELMEILARASAQSS